MSAEQQQDLRLMTEAFRSFERAAVDLRQGHSILRSKVDHLEERGRRRRLEALGRMAAELAHEVRNPLGSIRLFAGLLRDELLEMPHLCEMSEHILEASSSLEAIVSNLLAFAQPSRSAMRGMDLRALATDACNLLAPSCTLRGVALVQPEEEEECPVHADPEGMRQVLLNLLGNALAATPDGGRIEVRVSSDEGRTVLEIEDDGKGIEPQDLPRVFDPFFSRADGGTGLGLSVVHGIIERHGGRIRLDSMPGKGTLARVEIPDRHAEEREHD
jgi:two-component system sensor histidine kinase HydH